MPVDLMHDLRVLAARRRITMEEACNEALKIGLAELARDAEASAAGE